MFCNSGLFDDHYSYLPTKASGAGGHSAGESGWPVEHRKSGGAASGTGGIFSATLAIGCNATVATLRLQHIFISYPA